MGSRKCSSLYLHFSLFLSCYNKIPFLLNFTITSDPPRQIPIQGEQEAKADTFSTFTESGWTQAKMQACQAAEGNSCVSIHSVQSSG
jgi:hypothetical protein